MQMGSGAGLFGLPHPVKLFLPQALISARRVFPRWEIWMPHLVLHGLCSTTSRGLIMARKILCVAEKPAIARAVATHLSGGSFQTVSVTGEPEG